MFVIGVSTPVSPPSEGPCRVSLRGEVHAGVVAVLWWEYEGLARFKLVTGLAYAYDQGEIHDCAFPA